MPGPCRKGDPSNPHNLGSEPTANITKGKGLLVGDGWSMASRGCCWGLRGGEWRDRSMMKRMWVVKQHKQQQQVGYGDPMRRRYTTVEGLDGQHYVVTKYHRTLSRNDSLFLTIPQSLNPTSENPSLSTNFDSIHRLMKNESRWSKTRS